MSDRKCFEVHCTFPGFGTLYLGGVWGNDYMTSALRLARGHELFPAAYKDVKAKWRDATIGFEPARQQWLLEHPLKGVYDAQDVVILVEEVAW